MRCGIFALTPNPRTRLAKVVTARALLIKSAWPHLPTEPPPRCFLQLMEDITGLLGGLEPSGGMDPKHELTKKGLATSFAVNS